MSNPIQIRLGSLDSQSSNTRGFGRAISVRNIDIEKTNEVSKRKGYVRRLSTQFAGPVRLLHSFGGICGRFYAFSEGAGLFSISGNQGAGPLRAELDLDNNYPIAGYEDSEGELIPPEGIGDDESTVGSGGGNVGTGGPEGTSSYLFTPGGRGTVTTDDGVTIEEPGIQRNEEDVSTDRDDIVEDEDDPDFSFYFAASITALHTSTVVWTFADPGGLSPTGYVEIYRMYGTGDPVIDGELVRRESNLVGTYADTIDEYIDDINYTILFRIDGVGVYGPYDSSVSAKTKTLTVTAPATADVGTAFNLTVQGVHWTGTNDTSYSGACSIALSGSNTISPVSTASTGWASGAKTISCTISGSTSETATITVTDTTYSYTGSDTLAISVLSTKFSEDFSGLFATNWDSSCALHPLSFTAITFSGGQGLVSGAIYCNMDSQSAYSLPNGSVDLSIDVVGLGHGGFYPNDKYEIGIYKSTDSTKYIRAEISNTNTTPTFYLVAKIYNCLDGTLVTTTQTYSVAGGWPTNLTLNTGGTLTLAVSAAGVATLKYVSSPGTTINITLTSSKTLTVPSASYKAYAVMLAGGGTSPYGIFDNFEMIG